LREESNIGAPISVIGRPTLRILKKENLSSICRGGEGYPRERISEEDNSPLVIMRRRGGPSTKGERVTLTPREGHLMRLLDP